MNTDNFEESLSDMFAYLNVDEHEEKNDISDIFSFLDVSNVANDEVWIVDATPADDNVIGLNTLNNRSEEISPITLDEVNDERIQTLKNTLSSNILHTISNEDIHFIYVHIGRFTQDELLCLPHGYISKQSKRNIKIGKECISILKNIHHNIGKNITFQDLLISSCILVRESFICQYKKRKRDIEVICNHHRDIGSRFCTYHTKITQKNNTLDKNKDNE